MCLEWDYIVADTGFYVEGYDKWETLTNYPVVWVLNPCYKNKFNIDGWVLMGCENGYMDHVFLRPLKNHPLPPSCFDEATPVMRTSIGYWQLCKQKQWSNSNYNKSFYVYGPDEFGITTRYCVMWAKDPTRETVSIKGWVLMHSINDICEDLFWLPLYAPPPPPSDFLKSTRVERTEIGLWQPDEYETA